MFALIRPRRQVGRWSVQTKCGNGYLRYLWRCSGLGGFGTFGVAGHARETDLLFILQLYLTGDEVLPLVSPQE